MVIVWCYQNLGEFWVVPFESFSPLLFLLLCVCDFSVVWLSYFSGICFLLWVVNVEDFLMFAMICSSLVFVFKPHRLSTFPIGDVCLKLPLQRWHQKGWTQVSMSSDNHPLSPFLVTFLRIMADCKLCFSSSSYKSMAKITLFLGYSLSYWFTLYVLESVNNTSTMGLESVNASAMGLYS